jgi:hypothetical protein
MSLNERALFIRVGWAEHYDSRLDGGEAAIGGGSFNEDDVGSEVNNFRPIRGYLYGYVQTGSLTLGINVPRIFGGQRGQPVANTLVLMYATKPGEKGQRLVGWYQDAICYPEHQGDRPGGVYGLWNYRAPVDRAVLLPIAERTRVAPPREDAGFGQANVRYTISATGRNELHAWMKADIEYARAYSGSSLLKAK